MNLIPEHTTMHLDIHSVYDMRLLPLSTIFYTLFAEFTLYPHHQARIV